MAKQIEQARKPGRPATGKTPKRYFRMDDESWEAVETAARSVGVSTSEWVRDCLLRAAKRVNSR
jgi:predicted HicB family RNase H-like nuclease